MSLQRLPTTLGPHLTALGGTTFLLELTFARGAARSLLLPEPPRTRLSDYYSYLVLVAVPIS